MYLFEFKCSQRTVDLDNPTEFSELYSDELSELICEDANYIRWLSKFDMLKFEPLDIVTILSVHPKLFGHFYKKLTNKSTIDQRNWEYLTQFQPTFNILNPHLTNKAV